MVWGVVMPREKAEIIIVKPDPSLVFEKLRKIFYWKTIGLGIFLIVIGVLWYLRNTGALAPEMFWPTVLIVLGIFAVVKALAAKLSF